MEPIIVQPSHERMVQIVDEVSAISKERARSLVTMPSRQFGKSRAFEMMIEAMEKSGVRIYRLSNALRDYGDVTRGLEPLDRESGLKQAPPVAKKLDKLPAGHVWMRDRTGKMVARKL